MARATNRGGSGGCIGLAVLLGSGASATLAQPGGAGPQPGAGGQGFGRMLVEALRLVDGCLGAEAAQFTNGKLAIFGWFEDAEAARR